VKLIDLKSSLATQKDLAVVGRIKGLAGGETTGYELGKK
jgi:hypothetical protein